MADHTSSFFSQASSSVNGVVAHLRTVLPGPLQPYARLIVLGGAGAAIAISVALLARRSSSANSRAPQSSVEQTRDAPVTSVSRQRSQPLSRSTSVSEPAVFVAAKILEAEVVAHDDLSFGGVDSDEYDSLHTSALTERDGDDKFKHGNNVDATASVPVATADEASGSTTPKQEEAEQEDDDVVVSTPLVDFKAASQLMSAYSKAFTDKRDFDPSHIHPSWINTSSFKSTTGTEIVLHANPATISPAYIGQIWCVQSDSHCN